MAARSFGWTLQRRPARPDRSKTLAAPWSINRSLFAKAIIRRAQRYGRSAREHRALWQRLVTREGLHGLRFCATHSVGTFGTAAHQVPTPRAAPPLGASTT